MKGIDTMTGKIRLRCFSQQLQYLYSIGTVMTGGRGWANSRRSLVRMSNGKKAPSHGGGGGGGGMQECRHMMGDPSWGDGESPSFTWG